MIKLDDPFWDFVIENDREMFWIDDSNCIDITVKIVLRHITN